MAAHDPQHRTDPSQPYTAALLQHVVDEPEEARTLQGIVDLALATITSADSAGITVRRGRKLTTPAWTHDVVVAVDQAQYDLGEGPCIDAVWADDVYRIDDLGSETRWRRWAPAALELGVVSMLSIRLTTPRDVVGGLNFYAGRAHAFDDDDAQVAHGFAEHAAPALALTQELDGLRSALQTRHRIGAAQGVLRARHGVTLDQAFTVLVRISRDNNTPLRDVAARVVEANGLPAEFTAAGAGG